MRKFSKPLFAGWVGGAMGIMSSIWIVDMNMIRPAYPLMATIITACVPLVGLMFTIMGLFGRFRSRVSVEAARQGNLGFGITCLVGSVLTITYFALHGWTAPLK